MYVGTSKVVYKKNVYTFCLNPINAFSCLKKEYICTRFNIERVKKNCIKLKKVSTENVFSMLWFILFYQQNKYNLYFYIYYACFYVPFYMV